MKILILILNVLGFWLMADAAHADPITLAITAISNFLGSISIGKLLLTVAINVGLSLVEKALAKKEQPQPAGAKLEINMGDDHPMSFIIGSYATAGRRKYAGSWGEDGKTPNAYFTDVIEVGSLPNYAGERGLTSVWIDDQQVGVLWEEPHPDGRGFPVLQYRVNGKDYLWIKFLDGTQSGADAFLTAKFGANPDRPWKPTMVGLGCQVVILTARYNTNLFSGIPAGLYQPHPVPIYDIRKDSSVGGNGAHRWNNPATWEPTSNPATMIYNLARGVYYGQEWVYGGQNIGAFCLPYANWMAAANACDAAVALDGGGSEPAFRAGYEVQCDQQPLDVVSELLKACNGRMAEVGGIFKVLISTPGGAVYSFSDDDIVATEEQDFQPFPSLSDTYNAIEATYPEPTEKWATKDAPGRYNADLEAQDGNRRLPAQIQLPAVPFANQVQRVGLAMIQDYRRFRVHQVSLPPDAYPLEPNDVVSWTSARNGYDEKKFLVVKVEPQPNFLIVVTLKEVDPSDYDWHSGLQLPTATGWIGPITPPSQPMVGWTVEPATVKDAGGIDRRPAIKISCAPDMDDVERVWVQVRLKEAGDIVFDSDSTRYATPFSWVISGQWTLSNTDYEARGRYIPKSNRATDWSAWLAVKTPNVLIQSGDVLDGAIIASKIADAAVTAEKIMDEAVSNLKLADEAVSTAKIQVAAVTADVLASGAVISTKLADGAVTAAKLAQGAVDATSLASNIKAVEVVSALPTTGSVEGRQVFLTTDGKLYRYHDGAWTSAVPSADITGQLISSQIANAAITDQQLAALAVDASKLADNAITTAKIANNAISTPKLQANSVVAANIAANAITADKLVLGDLTNRVENPNFGEGDISWTKTTGITIVNDPSNAYTGNWHMNIGVGATGLASRNLNIFPVLPGEQYFLQVFAKAVGAPNNPLTVRMRFLLADKSTLVSAPTVGNYTSADTSYIERNAVVTVPATAVYAWIDVTVAAGIITTGGYDVGFVSCQRRNTGNLIVDGTITATKIAAGAVTAGALAANAVTAGTIAAGAVSASQIAADAVTADKIASNAVTTDALAVGSGKNLLQNAGFTMGMDCWATFHSGTIPNQTFRIRAVTETWSGPNCPTLMLWQNGPNTGNNYYNDIRWARPDLPALAGDLKYGMPCAPGDWFEVSAYVAAHRCLTELRLEWIGADGDAISFSAPSQNNAIAGSSTNPDLWTRLRCVGAAPANAVAVAIHLRKWETNTGSTDSYMFINKPMLCRCPPNATEATPWSDGGVVVITNGGIVADAITADKIATNAVTADAIAANAVTAGKIAVGAVTATTIAAATITGDKLAANTIGASQIAADAITAKQLVLTDFSNMADNGWQTGTLDGWTLNYNQAFYLDTVSGDASGWVYQSIGREQAASSWIMCTAGEIYAFDVWVYNTDSSRAAIIGRLLTPAGGYAYPQAAFTDLKNQWVRLQGRITVPSGYNRICMDLFTDRTAGSGTSTYWSKPVMRRAVSAELIVDGAVTANKISVNSLDAITASLGAVNISSAVIGSLQVGTSNISGGATSAMGVGRVAGTQTIGAGGTVNLVSCVVNVAGDGRVLIDAMTIGQYNQNGNSQNAQPIGCNIFRDGVAIFSQVYYLGIVKTDVFTTGGSNGSTTQTSYTAGLVAVSGLYDAPGPGNHTYILQIFCPQSTVGWNESNITATAFKR
ncbi:phage tail protein [Rhizobium mayense]|uniref:Phage tail protein n=1 Tax=Rhizobium mayense TaxID=1312184 RepID=A0ABT7JM91_9HYPH|nr:phage tail protein [Rhizobium mayense]MDL2397470.1 phage tail protein [Rhizobium mayense]